MVCRIGLAGGTKANRSDDLKLSEMIAKQRPDMDRLPALPMPRFEAASAAGVEAGKDQPLWVKKTGDGELRFRTVGQFKEMELKPLYQVMDERYSVYWQKTHKA